jgi:hypothetical protein
MRNSMIAQNRHNANPILAAAFDLHRNGLCVIPFEFKKKYPAIPWAEFQTRRPEAAELYEWFSYGRKNIGVVCGKVSGGLVVIDFDGEEAFKRFAQEHPEIVNNTWIAKTARGYHVYLRTKEPPRQQHRGRVDIKGEGSVVLTPPSVHPSGRRYTWVKRTKEILYVENLPALNDKPPADTADTIPETIREGERNTTLTSIAGTLRGLGLDEDEIRELLLIVNAEKTKPPLPPKEVATIAHSVCRYPPQPPHRMLGRPEEQAACVAMRLAKRGLDADLRSKLLAKLGELRGWDIKEDHLRDIAHKPLPQQVVEKFGLRAVTLLAPQLAQEVALILGGENGTKRLPINERRGVAGKKIVDWLKEHGFFTRTETGGLYYFYRPERRVYSFDDEDFTRFLYRVSGINPGSRDFAFIMADCQTAASESDPRHVVRVAYYDKENAVLYVSRFDGTVYILNGQSIQVGENGDRVVFADNPRWRAYSPEGGSGSALDWLCELPNWNEAPEVCSLALKAWILATLFSELCPTKPILGLIGDKGSGKTLLARLLLKLLFGPLVEVAGLPDRPDGFRAAASSSHILILDNLDGFVGWLRDILARLATGAEDPTRRFYTTNTLHLITYRTWVAFTSRDPQTFRRDDLADRLLILPLAKIPEEDLRPERRFLDQAEYFRNAFWGDLLNLANRVVAYIRENNLPDAADVRMADFESFGRVVARVLGQDDTWARVISLLLHGQAELLLDDPVAEALLLWLENKENQGRDVPGHVLHNELTQLYFEGHKPSQNWPKDARALGRRLGELKDSLRRIHGIVMARTHTKWGAVYRFTFTEPNGER